MWSSRATPPTRTRSRWTPSRLPRTSTGPRTWTSKVPPPVLVFSETWKQLWSSCSMEFYKSDSCDVTKGIEPSQGMEPTSGWGFWLLFSQSSGRANRPVVVDGWNLVFLPVDCKHRAKCAIWENDRLLGIINHKKNERSEMGKTWDLQRKPLERRVKQC